MSFHWQDSDWVAAAPVMTNPQRARSGTRDVTWRKCDLGLQGGAI
ncbi:hypothetical protein [Roseinatronobacter sp.]|nr:hypothetical protein [Rhodobaca sp.]